MNVWVYDEETFPNFFCATFIALHSEEIKQFIIDETKNDSALLKQFVQDKWLIGYNNHDFDDIILNYILSSSQIVTAHDIYKLAQLIINTENPWLNPFIKRLKRFSQYKSVDLIRLLFSKALRVGLKELQVTMNWPNVQELPYHHSTTLSNTQKLNVLEYNTNDSASTKKLALLSIDDLKLRHKIKTSFGLDCYSQDGVTTGVNLLLKLYCAATRQPSHLVKSLRTPRPIIRLGDIIADNVVFNSPKFGLLLEKLRNSEITDTRGSLDFSVLYGGVLHQFGTGGIHSKDPAGITAPGYHERYMDADVASLYPSILVEYGFKPAHLDTTFIRIYKFLKEDRLRAKRAGETLIADTYKLALNGAYGNLINEHSWLYDPQAAMSITLNGQLFLAMLSERLIDAGHKVDSLNTDGITCLVQKSLMDDYYSIAQGWMDLTRLELEFREYDKVIRRDVNTYFALYKNDREINGKDAGKVKEKGDWLTKPKLGKGYDKPIVNIALKEYFLNGTPIEETIKNHHNIFDFCMMQKVGKQFNVEWYGKRQQRINRYYASKQGAYLYKIKGEGSARSFNNLLKGVGVEIFNKHLEKNMSDYQIDYNYYIYESRKILNEIQPSQLLLDLRA